MEELKSPLERPAMLSKEAPIVVEPSAVLGHKDLAEKCETGIQDKPIDQCGTSEEQKKWRMTIDDWHLRYLEDVRLLTEGERIVLECVRPFVRKGIEAAMKSDGLKEYERLEEFKECYELELLIKFTPEIVHQIKLLTKWAKRLAFIRKPSAGNSLIRQREAIQANAERVLVARTKEGEIIETGQPEAKWWPLTPPNPFCCNPEEYTVNAETYKLVQKFRAVIETSGKKHTKTYLRVLEEIERGTDVGQADEERLGVQAKTIASRKHEMQVILQNYVAERDNEVDQRLKNIKALRKKKRKGTNSKELKSKKKKCKKSTFDERKALYRDPYAAQHKPKTKRDWSVVRGRGGKK